MAHAWLVTVLVVLRCTAEAGPSVVAVAGVNEAADDCGRYGLSVDPHEFGGIGGIGGNIGGSEDWPALSQRPAALFAARQLWCWCCSLRSEHALGTTRRLLGLAM